MTAGPAIGLVTCSALPQLTDDDQLLMTVMRRDGLRVSPVVWTDTGVTLDAFDVLILRSCWDYHVRPDDFLAWVRLVERRGIRLVNSAAIVRWNVHKSYLAALEAAGVSIPEAQHVARGSPLALASIMSSRAWSQAVVKPAISASAVGTWRVGPVCPSDEERFARALTDADLLVQRFVPEVARDGEWSLVFIGTEFSHAVVKRAAPGEFRVQSEFGGQVEAALPSPTMLSWARDVTRHIPHPWDFARLDAVGTPTGFMLMELECIEPELFFRSCHDASSRFTQLARKVVRDSSSGLSRSQR